MSALERANQTPVSPELFVEAMELFVEMPPEDRSVFDVRLVDFLRAKGFSGRHHADLVVAITFRSFALAHLVQSDPVKGWIISADERGMARLHAEIVRAAAAHIDGEVALRVQVDGQDCLAGISQRGG